MTKPIRILHLEDNPVDAELILAKLESDQIKCELINVRDRSSFERELSQNTYDLVLSDYSIPSYDGFSALEFARQKDPNLPFILLSGTLGEEQAVDSLKSGATDYILKQRLIRLGPAIRRALANAEEIAEHKRAELRIREQAALLDKAQDAICLNDMSQQILYWNKSAERLYGWTAEEAIGKSANDLLFQGDLKAPMEAILNLIRRGEWKGELNQVTKSGQKLIIESRWTLMRDDMGSPKSILVINTDITEKKQTEAKLLRTQRMESIGALAGGIAHDLNNALAPILMAADMIKEELVSESGKQLMDTMQKSAQRGADMVRQILSFSRGVTGEHSVLQLKHLIAETESFAKSTFPRSIRVATRVTCPLNPVAGDATQLQQILMNLCINARDAMEGGGTLRIEAENFHVDEDHPHKQIAGPHVRLTVADTGHGMSPEVIERIFEPFFTTKAPGRGTGLGLSTVFEIAKTHRGFVEVASELEKGTTFHVFLPTAAGESQVEDQKRVEPPLGSGELILLVDDEASILEMTKLMLEAYNYRILTAKEGAEAIACFEQHHQEIKAVVTDMMMPIMTGPDLIRKLKAIRSDVKVIAVSGLGSEAELSKAGRLIADAFLKKPFSTESLLIALHQLTTAK